MAGLRLHSPMLHPVHYCSRRRVCGQSYWLGFLCKTLSFSVSSRLIPALSLTPSFLPSERDMRPRKAENLLGRSAITGYLSFS